MSWLIYKHTNLANGKVYIGQTKHNPNERWRKGRGYTFNKNSRFCQAILKYGWNNFNHEIIEDNIKTQKEANERERYYIYLYDSYNFEHGYNMTIGGYALSDEAVDKARKTVKERTRNKIDFIFCYELQKLFPNPTIALEYFVNNGFCNNYKHTNPIHRVIDKENMTVFGYHFCRIINLFSFKPKGKEITNKNKGHKKKIICVDTGDVYDSLSDCFRITGIKTQYLSRACRNHTPTYGMYFSYFDEYTPTTWKRYEREKKVSSSAKSVFCVELNKTWESCMACCEELEVTTGELSRLLNNQDVKNMYHTIKGMHFCYKWQEEFIIIKNKPTTRKDSRKVYCVEKQVLYASITIAEEANNIKNILKCCNDWKYTSGGYHWCFEEDISKFEIKKQIERKNRNGLIKKVINLTTNECYESLSQAARNINRSPSTLSEAIRLNHKCAGCYWKYLYD